ncbi:hypothetical protein BOO90_19505 [Vibrio navarrensis]|nr:hypothetical protein [Vibrio navarrensis]
MEAAASSIWLLFFLLEYETQFTLTALDWLNFNSDNYPARGGNTVARKCYESFGFEVVSTEIGTRSFNGKLWDLVRMEKRL